MTSDEAYLAWKAAPSPETETALFEALRRHAGRILGGRAAPLPGDVEDGVQDVVTTVFVKLPLFRGEAAFSTWFFRLVVNYYKDRMRDHILKHKRNVPLDDVLGPVTFQDPETHSALELLRRKLSAEELSILEARLQGQTVKQIAEEDGISLHAAKSRWLRIRAHARELLCR